MDKFRKFVSWLNSEKENHTLLRNEDHERIAQQMKKASEALETRPGKFFEALEKLSSKVSNRIGLD